MVGSKVDLGKMENLVFDGVIGLKGKFYFLVGVSLLIYFVYIRLGLVIEVFIRSSYKKLRKIKIDKKKKIYVIIKINVYCVI